MHKRVRINIKRIFTIVVDAKEMGNQYDRVKYRTNPQFSKMIRNEFDRMFPIIKRNST